MRSREKLIALLVLFASSAFATNVKTVEGGTYKPLFGRSKKIQVSQFFIDETAVTNNDFLSFVKNNPRWSKEQTPILFADADYLKHWSLNGFVKASLRNSPVVYVSWFAAKAYCESVGKRLPTVAEWEYLAQFGAKGSSENPKTEILNWYSRPTPDKLPHVKSTFKNKFDVWDVHGLIWEWTDDFNTAFVTGESRGDSSLEKSMYCGAGGANSADPSDYAAFMRFGFRSSLKGNYTVANLGFRCVKQSQ